MEKNEFWATDFSESFISNSLSCMPGGFFVCKATSPELVLYANSALFEIFGCTSSEEFFELTDGNLYGMIYQEDINHVKETIVLKPDTCCANSQVVNFRIRTKNGQLKYVESYIRLCRNKDEGELFYIFISASHSKTDSLTGLPNRWYFFEIAEERVSDLTLFGKTPAFLAFDFTGLKGFNTRYGLEKGDQLLIEFSEILKKHFPGGRCSRFGEDHFYAWAESERIEFLLNDIIVDLYSANYGKTVPLRIGIANLEKNISVSVACERAKIASDTLKGFPDSDFAWFNDKMTKKLWKREYILSNIERAIDEHWIEPYFQPVVRTMSGEICSFEALARWRDPQRGLIEPSDFIPILEENNLSYKLDIYIVEQVATLIQRRIKQKLPVVPVSVNISQADFEFCDPVTLIADTCDRHGISRKLITIEITETAVINDKGFLKQVIDRFHSEGFEVWMDDFGSGYSSLNVLKDFEFDEIKIDMAFLKEFNERSKQIVTMAVSMAKSLGIHTLAEGVETKEHLDFLKSIGCERIQGYYYGKPLSRDEVVPHLKSKNLGLEPREEAIFYQKVGLENLISANSTGLFFYDGKDIKLIFKNEKFLAEMATVGLIEDAEIENAMTSPSSLLRKKFITLAESAIKTSQRETMTVIINGKYFQFSFKVIAKYRKGVMLRAVVDGSVWEDLRWTDEKDVIMRNIVSCFDSVYLVDLKKDTRTVIFSIIPEEKEGQEFFGINQFYKNYRIRDINKDDRTRWAKSMTIENIDKRLKKSGRGNFSDIYPVKKEDGSYEWTTFTFISIGENDSTRFLICVRPAEIEDSEDKVEALKRLIDFNELEINPKRKHGDEWLRALVRHSGIKFFWKDRDRRFLGASQAFLNYYGFTSEKKILGKNDEDMGWHINDQPYQEDELSVLKRGKVIRNSQGINIVNGISREILASKFPVYSDGKIVGLIGYFIDVSTEVRVRDDLHKLSLLDDETGFMNLQGMMISLIDLDSNFRSNKEDYFYGLLKIIDYEELQDDFGDNFSKVLLKRIAEILREHFSENVILARWGGGNFALAKKCENVEKLIKILKLCIEEISAITEIDGIKCKLKASYGVVMGSESDSVHKSVELAYKRQAANSLTKDDSLPTAKEIIPDLYSELPLPFIIVKPIIDKESKEAVDLEFLFVNQRYCEMTSSSREKLLGKGYRQTFPRTDKKWVEYCYRACEGEYISSSIYSGSLKYWLRFIASPSITPGACSVVFFNPNGSGNSNGNSNSTGGDGNTSSSKPSNDNSNTANNKTVVKPH